MNFRTIQPAPPPELSRPRTGASHRPGQGAVKRSQVAQACHDCRKTKIKCDGQRPKCNSCLSKNRLCGYAKEGTQLSVADTRSRLESLEKFIAALRTGPKDQAERLLDYVRTDVDLYQVMEQTSVLVATVSPTAPSSDRDHEERMSVSSIQESGNQIFSGNTGVSSSGEPPLSTSITYSTTTQSTITSVVSEQIQVERHFNSATISSHQPGHSAASEPWSSHLDQPYLPDPTITQQAIKAFFSCSGKLFHVFTREQVLEIYDTAFDTQTAMTGSKKAAVGSLMAVASVGAQYMPEEFSMQVANRFYSIARQYFEDIIEHQPLSAIRVCALLAQYNILDKAMVSLAYIEIGLAMSRLRGIGNALVRIPGMSTIDSVNLRNTWRTLIFFSSWLASSLGYISGNDIMSERVKLTDIISYNPTDIADVVQTEMTKICLLTADILRMQVSFKELMVSPLRSITEDLRRWYAELPEMMRLEASGQENLALETRRSILHVHLLYLGAKNFLYRRVVSHFLQSYMEGLPAKILQPPLQEVVLELTSEVSLAASTSVRILKLLLENNSIFRRCWLVISQTYTTCIILLHVAVQKQLHHFEPLAWEKEREFAEICLSVLAFCGSLDRVASQFHTQLSGLYEKTFNQHDGESHTKTNRLATTLQEDNVQSFPTLYDSVHGSYPQGHGFLLDIPPLADASRVNLSLSLMSILSKPFGDGSEGFSVGNRGENYPGNSTQLDYTSMVEHHQQNMGSCDSFQWDYNKLNASFLSDETSSAGVAALGNRPVISPENSFHRFVGSTEPSGWASAADIMTRLERSC